MEEGSRKRRKRNDLKRIILQTVAIAGVISVGLVAPNVLGAMAKLGLIPVRRQREYVRSARDRLVTSGMLEYEGKHLRLTQKGEALLRKLQLRDFKLKRPKRWDGKWRVIIFDIPEGKKRVRQQIRHTLQAIGFHRLQDSVWIFPYDCEDLITLIKADFRIGKDLLYLIVETLEYDGQVKSHFGLN